MQPINPRSFYPEGPLWHQGRLYYVEYSEDRVMCWDGAQNRPVWHRAGSGPCSLIPAAEGGLWVACFSGDRLERISLDGQCLERVEPGPWDQGFGGPNDFTSDGEGGFYFTGSGAFDVTAPPTGRVFHRARDGRLRCVASDIQFANGLALSPDGRRLFVSAHLAKELLVFERQPDNSLGPARRFLSLPDLLPEPAFANGYTGGDGMKIDRSGRFYICQFGAARILVCAPDGAFIRAIEIPDRDVTNVGFGPDESSLFVTAVTDSWTAPYPGLVYRLDNPMVLPPHGRQ
jgi:sugar lactone lactonase YvrE